MWLEIKKYIYILALMLAVAFVGGITFLFFSNQPSSLKIYTIGVDETWYPLDLYGRAPYFSGFSKELVRTITAEHNYEISFASAGADALVPELQNGDYDGILSSVDPDILDKTNYILSNPYYLLGPVLLVSQSSHIQSLKDLDGKTIGLINSEVPLSALDKYPSVNFVFYDWDDRFKLLNDVGTGVIDGMVMNAIPAYEYAESGLYQDQLKIASMPLSNEGLRLVMLNNPSSQEFIDQFNEGLEKLKKNGAYDRLLKKWYLFNTAKPDV